MTGDAAPPRRGNVQGRRAVYSLIDAPTRPLWGKPIRHGDPTKPAVPTDDRETGREKQGR